METTTVWYRVNPWNATEITTFEVIKETEKMVLIKSPHPKGEPYRELKDRRVHFPTYAEAHAHLLNRNKAILARLEKQCDEYRVAIATLEGPSP